MDTKIRVKTSAKYRRIYTDLRKVIVEDSHELFFLCACMGYRNDRRAPLGNKGEERFWSDTITPEEWACYYAIILESSEYDYRLLKDDEIVIETIQEYANGGMEILIDDMLKDYLSANKEGEYFLDSTVSKELPRALLNFIYDIASGVV